LAGNVKSKRPKVWEKQQLVQAMALRAVSLKGYETVRKRWKL